MRNELLAGYRAKIFLDKVGRSVDNDIWEEKVLSNKKDYELLLNFLEYFTPTEASILITHEWPNTNKDAIYEVDWAEMVLNLMKKVKDPKNMKKDMKEIQNRKDGNDKMVKQLFPNEEKVCEALDLIYNKKRML